VGRYIIRRLLIAIPTLLVISFVVYAILALAPGDPLSQFATNPNVPPEVRERIREQLGLNQPWHIRYVKWLLALVKGDFGYSFMSHLPVINLLIERLPNTLAVVGVAYVLGVALAVPIGMISAVKRYSVFDHLATTFAFIGFSVPTLHWFPFIYDSTLKVRDFASLIDQMKQSIMPIIVLALFDTATLARYIRAEMLEHLPLDYVRTARGKGIAERLVVVRHVLRNSLIPVVTLVALGVPAVFAGAIVTEQIFRVPGIGELLIRSINDSDTPVVAAIVFLFAVLVVLFNLIADVLYAVLDPRIRYA
jgi:peptide/nickel transport system permease protein